MKSWQPRSGRFGGFWPLAQLASMRCAGRPANQMTGPQPGHTFVSSAAFAAHVCRTNQSMRCRFCLVTAGRHHGGPKQASQVG